MHLLESGAVPKFPATAQDFKLGSPETGFDAPKQNSRGSKRNPLDLKSWHPYITFARCDATERAPRKSPGPSKISSSTRSEDDLENRWGQELLEVFEVRTTTCSLSVSDCSKRFLKGHIQWARDFPFVLSLRVNDTVPSSGLAVRPCGGLLRAEAHDGSGAGAHRPAAPN